MTHQKDFSCEGVRHALDGGHGGLAPHPELPLVRVDGWHEVQVDHFEGETQGGALKPLLLYRLHRQVANKVGILNLKARTRRLLYKTFYSRK